MMSVDLGLGLVFVRLLPLAFRVFYCSLALTIGSRPSDHYFRSVCWFVCLCRVF